MKTDATPDILIIEDEAGLAQALRAACEQMGHRCRVTANARAGREQAAHLAASLRLIVLDIGLPDRSGLDLLPELRSLLPGVPLLVLLGALVGLLTGPVSPILNAAIYNRTPSALLGRVLGAISAVMLSAAPAVMLAAGALVDVTGPGPGLVVSAGFAGGVALLTLRLRFGPLAALELPTADRPGSARGER